jgi:dienelactone hydrolase
VTRLLSILAGLFCLVSPCASAPLEAYGRLPNIEAVQISPDGQMLASIVTNGEDRFISVSRISNGALVKAARAGDHKVRAIQWAGSNHLLITVTTTALAEGVEAVRAEWGQLLDFDLTTGKLKMLMDDAEDAMNVSFGAYVRIVDGKPVVVIKGAYFPGGGMSRMTLFQVRLDEGIRSKRLPGDFPDTIDWVVDAAGEGIAQASYEQQTGKWTLRMKQADGRWRVVRTEMRSLETPDLEGLGRDGKSVLVSVRTEEKLTYHELSPAGELGPTLPIENAENLIWDPVSYRLSGYHSLVQDEGRYTFFDAADEKTWRAILKAYPGARVDPVSSSQDRRKIVVLVDSPAEGPAYALVDMDTKRATWLGALYPDATAADIGQVKPVRYKAADGLELTGYLTLPHGKAGKGLPLVVLPHGGPAVRDNPGFDWWAQALASRGYAVLQVNYRGSDGFGWKFLSAGFGQWGRKMQTDLSDGVRYLAGQGIIDPKRVCIVGASYGGYAALAGATFDHGVYRCAASVAGPGDLRKLAISFRNRTGIASQRYWLRFYGAQKLSDDVVREISPAAHADQADIPILMVHGRDDTVVPLAQSQQMADALRKAGKPVELVVMKGEDHWLTRGDTRLQMLQSVVEFLERNNPPG